MDDVRSKFSMKPTKPPLFSVIIPTHGRRVFLHEALKSLQAQSIPDWEAIVVDDCSPEPVQPNISDSRIRVIRRLSNGGPAAARNSGLEVATGKYLAFLDDDDLFVPDRLKYARAALNRAPVGLCWFGYSNEGASRRALEGDVSRIILNSTVPHLGATSVLREIMIPFNESYLGLEDVEWWIRMRHHRVATEGAVGYIMRKHDGPRVLHGTEARINATARLMADHASYFAGNRRATAFRLERLARMQRQIGASAASRSSFLRAAIATPSAPRLAGAFGLDTSAIRRRMRRHVFALRP
jgi:glycosyltransferase involved in cell wall biosynthesis